MKRTHRIVVALAAFALAIVAYAWWSIRSQEQDTEPIDDNSTIEFLAKIESLPKFTDEPSIREETASVPTIRLRGKLLGELEDDLVYGVCVSPASGESWHYEPALAIDSLAPGIDTEMFQGRHGKKRPTAPVAADGSFEVDLEDLIFSSAEERRHILVFARLKTNPDGFAWLDWPAPIVGDLRLTEAQSHGESPLEVVLKAPIRVDLRIDRREAVPGDPVEVELNLAHFDFGSDFLGILQHERKMDSCRLVCPDTGEITLLLPRYLIEETIHLGAASQSYRPSVANQAVTLREQNRVDLKVHGFATVALRIPKLIGDSFGLGDVDLRYFRSDHGDLDWQDEPRAYGSSRMIQKLENGELGTELQLLSGRWQIEVSESALPLNRIHWQFVAKPGAHESLQGSWKKARAALEIHTAFHGPFQPMFQPDFWWRSRADGWQRGAALRWKQARDRQGSETVSRDVDAAAAILFCGTGEDPPRSQLCLLRTDSIQATSSASRFICRLERSATRIEVPAQTGTGSYSLQWLALADHPDLPMASARDASEESPALLVQRVFSPRGGWITGFPAGRYRLRTLSNGVVESDEVVEVIES